VPAGLSALVIVRKVEQRFGMIGLARLIRLVELVADASTVPAPGSAVVAWGDALQALGCAQDAAVEFLTYCEHAQVLERSTGEGMLQLTLRGELAAMLVDAPAEAAQAAPVLFTREQQLADWFMADLNCPPYLANDPGSRSLFRRWIATNVTVEEIEAAVQMAIEAREPPSPAALHDHLRAVRNAKIERART
jgi:hypothetical protein